MRYEDGAPTGDATGRQTNDVTVVIGVGASAGGLEALRALFSQIGNTPDVAFVVVQHLAPNYRSMLAQLIAKDSALRVKDIDDGERAEPRIVYITPPNKDVAYEGGIFKLFEPVARIAPKPSIDSFFMSLGEALGEKAIGIVLSGTGSDGTHGARAIKAAGGMIIAQDPDTAKYDGMPRSVIAAGVADHILSPERIGQDLGQLIGRYVLSPGAADLVDENEDPYKDILQTLRRRCRVDFTFYKPSTVRRRIQRRMDANQMQSLAEYQALVRQSTRETQSLFQDILINVTAFFRDAGEYEALRAEVGRLLDRLEGNEQLRIWTAGCATGEEPYSLAIMLLELMDERKRRVPVQLFATDVDEVALAWARRGVYSEASLANVPAALVDRYFARQESSFQVKKVLRDMVIFARHDVFSDAPFVKVDLITCRNVFIYFTPAGQERAFRTFHYAMKPGALLFLGTAETTSGMEAYFEAVDDGHIFRKTSMPTPGPDYVWRTVKPEVFESRITPQQRQARDAVETLIPALAPRSILVNEALEIKHVFGDATRFLTIPTGQMSSSVVSLLDARIRDAVATVIYRVKASKQTETGRTVTFDLEGEPVSFKPTVSYLDWRDRVELLIRFDEAPAAALSEGETGSVDQRAVHELEGELSDVRRHLQDMLEAQAASGEEMQALNEELNAANEELQSTNEELETSNEELQSTNEELTTLNEELNVKSHEVTHLNEHLESIQNAIDFPLFVVDREFNVARFNRAAAQIFGLHVRHVGRSLKAVVDVKLPTDAMALIDQAYETKTAVHRQVQSDQRIYEVQADPICGSRGELSGIVVSFVDNTKLATAFRDLESKEAILQSILDNTPAMVSIKDSAGVYRLANKRFVDSVGRPVVGHTDEELFPKDTARAMREKDTEVMKTRAAVRIEEELPVGGESRLFLSSKFPLTDADQHGLSVCSISLDLSDRVRNEERLALFKRIVASAGEGILIYSFANEAFEFASAGFERVTGRPGAALIGRSLDEGFRLILGRRVAPRSVREQLFGQKEGTQEIAAEEGPNGRIWYEIRHNFLDGDGGGSDQGRLILLIFDVTERKRTEDTIAKQQNELIRASKLSALGQMAAGIAHEMNTPLNAIQGYVDMLGEVMGEAEIDRNEVRAIAGDIEKTVDSIASVIRGLRTIAKMDRVETSRPCNIRDIIDESLRICSYHLRHKGIQIQCDIESPSPVVAGQFVQLTQVLINLINNSSDAIRKFSDRWIRIQAYAEGDQCVVRCIDSGEGISRHLAQKVMQPFFTTREDGTGLGLSLAQSILKAHGGRLEIDFECKNTCFTISLPLHQQDVHDHEPAQEARN